MINYAYWLSNIPGIGIRTRNRLIGAAGSAREVYGLTEKQLLLIPGVEEKHAQFPPWFRKTMFLILSTAGKDGEELWRK